MHYQLFLPGRKHFAPNIDLAAVGLEGLERPGDHRPKLKVGRGPGGGRGLFVVWQPNEAPGYWPERQTWLRAKHDESRGLAAGRFYIGFDDSSPIRAAELERDSPAFEGGTPSTLGDGRTWIVPQLSWLLFRSRLNPHDYHCRQAIEAIAALHDAHQIGQSDPIFAATFDVCLKLLALNYRVTRGVCLRLGLFDADSVAAILSASCAAPSIRPAEDYAKQTVSL